MNMSPTLHGLAFLFNLFAYSQNQEKPFTVETIFNSALNDSSEKEFVEKNKSKTNSKMILEALEKNYRETHIQKRDESARRLIALNHELAKKWHERHPILSHGGMLLIGAIISGVSVYFYMNAEEPFF